ncbi:MAG TPA: hypothetical protein VJK54_01250 [Chthoniobacterales bacterium]|nr:hypothetical protein [Chthoniobacterales bacterium]
MAAGYREVAVTLEQAADQHKKAVDLYKFELELVGKSLQDKAGYQAKASEAEEEGKMILSAGYREAIVTSEQAVNQGELSAMKFSTSTYEGLYWLSEALCLRTQADYQSKAIEAEEAGKATLGAGYREASMTLIRAAEQHKQSAQLCVIGSCSDLGYSTWHGIGRSIQAKANYQAKASEAKEEGKEILAAIYAGAAIISERAADQFKQAVEAYIAGKESERKNWVSAGEAFESQVEYQVTSMEAQETGKTILAIGYSEAAITSQQAADQFILAAETTKVGKENEGGSWGNEGSSLQKKADYQVKLCKAEKINQITRAANYREAIIVLQRWTPKFGPVVKL